jgi:hypothetical protein
MKSLKALMRFLKDTCPPVTDFREMLSDEENIVKKSTITFNQPRKLHNSSCMQLVVCLGYMQ